MEREALVRRLREDEHCLLLVAQLAPPRMRESIELLLRDIRESIERLIRQSAG